jgi:hypothetical protein
MATKMQYQDCIHKHTPGVSTDVFDGEIYHSLLNRRVKFGGKALSHNCFADGRDIALGLSTDGFAPFKRCKNTAWPLIIFNYNLPPELWILEDDILSLGIIPGLKKPVDADSFLWPLLCELRRLAFGVCAFDILSSKLFSLRAFLILVFGDIPAISMII